jgi:hypothetical protein
MAENNGKPAPKAESKQAQQEKKEPTVLGRSGALEALRAELLQERVRLARVFLQEAERSIRRLRKECRGKLCEQDVRDLFSIEVEVPRAMGQLLFMKELPSAISEAEQPKRKKKKK